MHHVDHLRRITSVVSRQQNPLNNFSADCPELEPETLQFLVSSKTPAFLSPHPALNFTAEDTILGTEMNVNVGSFTEVEFVAYLHMLQSRNSLHT